MAIPTPPAEQTISAELIRALLQEQKPELADLPLVRITNGYDNEIHRVGDNYAVRMPRRAAAAANMENELRWLAELGPTIPIGVPTPVLAGKPAMGYPWPWSVVPWFDGVPLAHSPPLDQDKLVADLSGALNALHVPAHAEAPTNHYRGVHLRERDALTRGYAEQCDGVDVAPILELWEELVDTPEWGGEPMWLHGDVHPFNLIVRGGRLAAIIDFGDVTAGDPATDLAVAWMLFDEDGRYAFRTASRVDDKTVDIHTWNRSRAWALTLALAMVAHYSADDPTLRRVGLATLNQVL